MAHSPLLELGSHERDRGAIVMILCPDCDQVNHFHLVQVGSSVALYKIFGFGTRWELCCFNCCYRHPVMVDDLIPLQDLKRLLERLECGDLTPKQYANRLIRTNIRLIQDLLSGNSAWTCPSCNASVPDTFHHCWRCECSNPNPPRNNRGNPDEPPVIFYQDPITGATSTYSNPRAFVDGDEEWDEDD